MPPSALSMDALLGRGRRRKSDVVPLVGIVPGAPGDADDPSTGRRVSRVRPMNWSQRNIIQETTESVTSPPVVEGVIASRDRRQSTVKFPPVKPTSHLNSFAQSIISMNRQQRQASHSRHDDEGDDRDAVEGVEAAASMNQEQERAAATVPVHDPWSQVLTKVIRKTSFRTSASAVNASSAAGGGSGNGMGGASTLESKRVSFSNVLKSREVKDLVKQAIVANHWSEKTAARNRAPSPEHAQRSSVMDHWVKTAAVRHANPLTTNGNDDNDGLDDDEDADTGIKSGFALRDSPIGSMYGRTLLLEESCRRAFEQSGENRSQTDLQALKAWFQMTKLKITTDFERLQPAELDLLCRRMVLVHLHANEVVFRQGDEGDAMYILFAGCVEVKVAQQILGEKVEVTVCELSKGDYFGERALLHDEPRAATIVAKTSCELVRITRKDYNIMLKQDQQEFFSRMQLAGSVHTSLGVSSTLGNTKPTLLLPRSRSTLHQQTQLEYINVLSKKKHARTKADIDMLSEYLQTLKFFRGLPKTFVRELCSVVDFFTLAPSSYVFREGEVGDQFYIIFSGSVDVIVSSKDIRGNTQQTKLINLTEGAHFGELALMKGHGIRSATVLTREETKFLVICEKDYNATLRRMQKEDLAKRVGVLDRIPMFQTPEWTGELLKEMSYVLSEQKLATGAVLFRQGEKAQQVYFVVRGELMVTKEILDPVTSQTHVVFVERIGRDRVVGDDAAAGMNFNEVIYREVTVTASTPVELLVLSKYDVFHRLSRSARETLRAAAHSHVETVVYLDRFHKTAKWDAYKQKLLHDHLNHERMHKLLPTAKRTTEVVKAKTSPRLKTASSVSVVKDDVPVTEVSTTNQSTSGSAEKVSESIPSKTSGALDHDHIQAGVRVIVETKSELVDANEFLLLEPVTTAIVKCFPPTERTLTDHLIAFNPDAPPRAESRDRQLKSAIKTEQRREVEMLNEGNPLAYFNLDAINAQQRKQQAEVRGRAASSRRLILRKRESSAAGVVGTGSSSSQSEKAGGKHGFTAADVAAKNAMNQFFQENFVFSHPKKPLEGRKEKHQRKLPRSDLDQRHSLHPHADVNGDEGTSSRKRKNAVEASQLPTATDDDTSEMEAMRKIAEQLCIGDFVVVDVEQPDLTGGQSASAGSPAFRIVRCCDSIEAARFSTLSPRPQRHVRSMNQEQDGLGEDEDEDEHGRALYVLPKKKFALLPRMTRPRVTEEAQQRAVVGRFLRAAPLSATIAATHAHVTDPMAIFASFQKLSMTPNEQQEATTIVGGGYQDAEAALGTGDRLQLSLRMFASVSIVLSKRELENAFCEEPFLCVHALYPTEAEAMESALLMPPQALKNALLCILPVGEWLHFDEAYDWCVQIETDRRDKHLLPPTSASSTSPLSSPSRRKTGSMCGLPGVGADSYSSGAPRADWEIEKEKAQRLHQFICTRMGLGKAQERERRGGDAVLATGFTPRPTVTLEAKLATLQDYLETTSHAPLGGKTPHAHVSILGKYRQMKRFGSIMRSRISAVSPPPTANSAGSPPS